MQRVTEKQLQAVCRRINDATGSPQDPYTYVGTKCEANIGSYHLDHAYGGVALHRMHSKGGGVEDVFGGHYPKRELAFLKGIEAMK